LLVLFAFLLLIPTQASASPHLGPTISVPDLSESMSHKDKAKKKSKKKAKKKKKRGKNAEPPPPPPDADADGIPDESDQCKDEPEDIDLFEDKDGCPDTDNDGDGISDEDDDCPNEAENKDGWSDEDGCPEADPALAPMSLSATLNDGTTLSGTLLRLIAVDEDSDTDPHEPTQLEVTVGESELFNADWSAVRALKAEKKKVAVDDFNCYSEGPPGIGEDNVWECTLDYPMRVTLDKSDYRGTHRVSDSKQHRMDLQIDGLECEGPSCEAIEATRTLSVYLYRMIAIRQLEDEFEAVKSLQGKLRDMHPGQLKSLKLAPLAE
jgi:hypothetical protein